MSRKTVPVEMLLDIANKALASPGGSPEMRVGIIQVVEAALFGISRYKGFYYLAEEDVPEGEKPGIRWGDPTEYVAGDVNRFKDVDPTRRRIA